MLLITRRPGEAVVINGAIEVQVVEVRPGRVKLGFSYPEGNTVYRQELYMKIMEENRSAAGSLSQTANIGTLMRSIGMPEAVKKSTPPKKPGKES